MTEAILEREEEDNRQCEITGKSFKGIRESVQSQKDKGNTTKVLMVHGISKHIPGYSTRFREKLVTQLGLDAISETHKEIRIHHKNVLNSKGERQPLGVLRVSRHTSTKNNNELLFYELTWSEITDPDREELAFDNSGAYSFKRTNINNTMKGFFNNTIPDLMAYRGDSHDKINYAVGQAVCWTFAGGWQDLPSKSSSFCDMVHNDYTKSILRDDYFFVTHSLGSRITVDTIAASLNFSEQKKKEPGAQRLVDALQKKDFQIYMLSNQLPLLQLGLGEPKVADQQSQFCNPSGAKFNERVFNSLDLIAFSDPNDILSYPVPPEFARRFIDSRLCAEVVNVNINVTPIKSAFGLDFANPAAAHSGYHEDDRVISLVTEGLSGFADNAALNKECRWIKTVQ